MQGTGHTCPEQQLTKQTEKSMWHSVQKHQQERKRENLTRKLLESFLHYTQTQKSIILVHR